MLTLAIIAAILSMLFLSVSDFFTKTPAQKLGNYGLAIFVLALSAIPLGLAFFFFPPAALTTFLFTISILAGVSLGAGYLLVFKSLETEQSSSTWALTNIAYIPIVLFGIFFLREALTTIEIIAILAILIGSWAITVTKGMKFNRSLLPAILGNLAWGVYNIFTIYVISQTSPAYSSAYFIAAVVATVMVVFIGVLFKKIKKNTFRNIKVSKVAIFTLLSGLALGATYVTFTFVTILKSVAIGGAILVLEPAIVVIFSLLMYKEKLTSLQAIGVVVSIVGALALAVL